MIPAGLTDDAMEYVRETFANLSELGVTVTLEAPDDAGPAGSRLGGYFDEDGPSLYVAPGIPPHLWLAVLIHEVQHVRQWREKRPTWTATLPGDCCAWYVFDAWLAGVVELTPAQRDAAIRLILDCERECEELSLEVIEARPGLGLSPEWYRKRANVYLAFHGAARLTRRWYDRYPYADPALVEMMPGDRLLTVDEAIRPSPATVAAIMERVYSEV